VLALPEKMGSAMFILIQFGCVAGIFAACIAIDTVRKYTVGRLERAEFVGRACVKIESFFEAVQSMLLTER
jgi:hypothetical protein